MTPRVWRFCSRKVQVQQGQVPLKRNSGIRGSEEFFPIRTSYVSTDTDLEHLSEAVRNNIEDSDLYLSLVVFAYAARRAFGEEDLYSVPHIMSWSELFSIN